MRELSEIAGQVVQALSFFWVRVVFVVSSSLLCFYTREALKLVFRRSPDDGGQAPDSAAEAPLRLKAPEERGPDGDDSDHFRAAQVLC